MKKAKEPSPTTDTWDDLAVALGVDIRKLHRYRKTVGAPELPDLAQWRIFIAGCSTAKATPERTPADSDKEQYELRYLAARARREERQDQVEAGELITKSDAKRLAESIRDAFIAEGERLPSQVTGILKTLKKTDKELVEQAIATAWKATRDRIAQGQK